MPTETSPSDKPFVDFSDVWLAYNDELLAKNQFAVEAINLTDETQRVHGRNPHQALYVTQTGPRFMIGARYKFQ